MKIVETRDLNSSIYFRNSLFLFLLSCINYKTQKATFSQQINFFKDPLHFPKYQLFMARDVLLLSHSKSK